MDYDALSRHQLQQLCKEHNIKANLSNKELVSLLQNQLGPRPGPSHVAERTRAGRTPSSAPARAFPTAPSSENSIAPLPRTQHEPGRRSRAASRSTTSHATTPALVTEVEPSAVESEKENKRDPVRRKAKDTQKRLGVGKPRVAGGAGARTVTRIIPSRGSGSSRTRSRADPVEEAARMEVVIEEEAEDVSLPQPPTAPTPNIASTSTISSATNDLTRRLATIESQVSQLLTLRETLLSQLAVQERGLVSVRDEIVVDRARIINEAAQLAEQRISQQLAEANADRLRIQEALDLERARVISLESLLGQLTGRLDALEANSAIPSHHGLPDVHAADGATTDAESSSAAVVHGLKRRIPSDVAESAPVRASKRARHAQESHHTYTTADRLETALAQPVSPASAPAASSSADPPPVAPSETPRTPPMTRHSRRQLVPPPGSPRGVSLTPAQMRGMVGAMPASPTTDSPRKGMKGKGKEPPTSLLLASPAKVKKNGQASKESSAEAVPAAAPSAMVASAPVAPTHASGLSLLSGASAPRHVENRTAEEGASAAVVTTSTSPAFPIYEPSRRSTRRNGAGVGLGLGRPSAVASTAPAPSAASPAHPPTTSTQPPPGGLLPAFSFSGRPPVISGTTDAPDADGNTPRTVGSTPNGHNENDLMLSSDEMFVPQDPITPMMSGMSGINMGMGSLEHSWAGIHGLITPEDDLALGGGGADKSLSAYVGGDVLAGLDSAPGDEDPLAHFSDGSRDWM